MVTSQEIVGGAYPASGPATYPAVAVPEAGEKFSDEDLHARFNVPAWGGIRVSLDKKCMALVAPAARSGEGGGLGRTVSYAGQDSDREGAQDQEMADDCFPTIPLTAEPAEPHRLKTQAASNNLSLSRSKEEGYTVLYFTRGRGVDDLRFDSRVEYDSHRFEVEQRAGRPPRAVVRFRLRRVEGIPGAAASGTGHAAGPRGARCGETGEEPGASDPAGHAAGIPCSARRAIGEAAQAHAPSGTTPRADRPATLLLPGGAQASPSWTTVPAPACGTP